MGYPLAKILRSQLERKIHAYEPMPVLDAREFAWAKRVESLYPEIRKEVETLLKDVEKIQNFNDVLPGQRALKQDAMWKSYFLYALKKEIIPNCAACPNTLSAIKEIPGVINAFFSILKPGVEIPPHRGPYAGIMRYHLGVIIPKGDVGIRVDKTVYRWEEGKSLFFDDSFDHEAWNRTDSIRVILFVDIERELPTYLGILNRILINIFSLSKSARYAQKKITNSVT